MRVYRLENALRGGIFTSGLVYDARDRVTAKRGKTYWHEVEEPDPYRHPNPYEDVPGWSEHEDQDSFYCGFRSIEHLTEWFDSEAIRVALNELGAVMQVYEAAPDDVLEGRAQIMFRRDKAELVETLPIPTLAA